VSISGVAPGLFVNRKLTHHRMNGSLDVGAKHGAPAECRGDELWVLLFEAPGNKITGVEGDAKEIGGNEAELRCANSDNADYGAVESGNDPALPEFLTNEHGGEHSQNAGKIVEANHVEHL